MKRFWLCAVAILSLCNLSHSDVCKSLCSCSAHEVDCEGKGIDSSLLLNISFPTSTTSLNLHNNEITQLPENAFSGLTNLKRLVLWVNAITQLPERIFSGLTNLTYL
ncbi:leucine-rich repeat and transmembrane domain-containing protein 2-like [Acropora millepora]|uniref:leucine-rich repeat and transmembrane domain-containing protein 2-like n=1 Tax=Acropora millepora TaxID=45264 RepID=UPI001CF3E6BA|nr:leucine-rich repeat and transmembrane domain-containing protein 2-like [Acropora millepora]